MRVSVGLLIAALNAQRRQLYLKLESTGIDVSIWVARQRHATAEVGPNRHRV